jgi:hypothetical protein
MPSSVRVARRGKISVFSVGQEFYGLNYNSKRQEHDDDATSSPSRFESLAEA